MSMHRDYILESDTRHNVVDSRILIVDDDPELCATVARYLASEGFAASVAANGAAMRRALHADKFDLIVLDLGLRNESGLDVLRQLRMSSAIAVLILTGKADPVDRVVGLELGADDYLAKPFLNRELLARVKAVLRRVRAPMPKDRSEAPMLRFDGWTIDLTVRRLTAPDGKVVALTTAEFDLLVALARSAGQPLDRDQLLEIVHRRHRGPLDRSIDVHISNLRRKLNGATERPDLIVAVRNVGYLLAATLETVKFD